MTPNLNLLFLRQNREAGPKQELQSAIEHWHPDLNPKSKSRNPSNLRRYWQVHFSSYGLLAISDLGRAPKSRTPLPPKFQSSIEKRHPDMKIWKLSTEVGSLLNQKSNPKQDVRSAQSEAGGSQEDQELVEGHRDSPMSTSSDVERKTDTPAADLEGRRS